MISYKRKGFDTMGLFSRLFGSKKKDKKYKLGMNKTRTGVLGNLKKLLSSKKMIDDELFDELEEMFIMADIGVDTVIKFMDDIKMEVERQNIKDPSLLQEIIVDKMFEIYLMVKLLMRTLKLIQMV